MNVAVTERAVLMVTTQMPVPLQSPAHPANTDPEAGVAVSETAVPSTNAAEQLDPQPMPAGVLVTVPLPAPARETFNVN